jgi:hypothetical protein
VERVRADDLHVGSGRERRAEMVDEDRISLARDHATGVASERPGERTRACADLDDEVAASDVRLLNELAREDGAAEEVLSVSS